MCGICRRRKGQRGQDQGRALPKVQAVSCCGRYLFLVASHGRLVGRTQSLSRAGRRARLPAFASCRQASWTLCSADDWIRREHGEAMPLAE
jgi:hypothetical protein